MTPFNGSHSSRPFRIRHLLVGLLILSQEALSICPSVCRCGSQSASCGSKNLAAIPVGLPDHILTLSLEYNQLTKLAAGAFSNLSKLTQLHLYNNQIQIIEDDAFRGLESLELLDLTSNNISVLTNGTFANLTTLEKLYLRNNRLSPLISSVFSQLPRLRELDLASNDIEEFPTDISRDLINVEILDLSYNPASLLATPVLGQMVALYDLKLNYLTVVNNASVEDSIPNWAFDGLSNLRNLELNGNRLTKIPSPVKTLPNLTTISLYQNSIQSVNADDFHQPCLLEGLDISHNSLVEIPTSALAEFPYLTKLYLDYNPIPVIPALAFSQNPVLANLFMAYTNLTTIDRDAFVGLGRLRTLYLIGNNLTSIVDGAMTHVNPNVNLQLSGNPIRCDCHLRGFAAWLKNNHTGMVNGGSSLQCVTPNRLSTRSVTDLLPNQFACEPRSTSPTSTVSVLPGTKVLLPCAIDADPALYYWITHSHEVIFPELPQALFAVADNGSLLIANVSLLNEGRYTCVVGNDAGEARHSVVLHVTSNPTSRPTTKFRSSVTTAVATTTREGTRGNSGLVFGIAATILAIVLVLIIAAALVVRRRNRKAKPVARNIPLPPLPSREICGLSNDILISPCNSSDQPVYEAIPADRTTSHRVTEPEVEQSHSEVRHTYFSRIDDSTVSQCDQGLKDKASDTDDGYISMKPETE